MAPTGQIDDSKRRWAKTWNKRRLQIQCIAGKLLAGHKFVPPRGKHGSGGFPLGSWQNLWVQQGTFQPEITQCMSFGQAIDSSAGKCQLERVSNIGRMLIGIPDLDALAHNAPEHAFIANIGSLMNNGFSLV